MMEEDDLDGEAGTAAAAAKAVDAKLAASFAGELPTPRAVVAADCALTTFSMSPEARGVVVSLDLSGNKLSTLSALVAGKGFRTHSLDTHFSFV